MDFNQKVLFSERVFAQEVDGEMVLLDMADENYFGLDDVGSDIWRLFQEGKTLQQTHDALLEIYDVTSDELKRDIIEFVQKLVDAGLAKLQA